MDEQDINKIVARAAEIKAAMPEQRSVIIRNAKGQLMPGTRSPRTGHMEERKLITDFREKLFQCVTEQDFEDVVNKLLYNCKVKNVQQSNGAIKILFDFCIGKPKQEIEARVTHAISKEEQVKLIRDTLDKKLGLEDSDYEEEGEYHFTA
jgi:hypothetical protein